MFSIRLTLFIILISAISAHVHASKSYQHKWELSGNIFEITIPATAFMTTLSLRDFDGSQEFVKGFIATGLTAFGLKYAVNEKRPRHGNHSFPSGHTAMAFCGSGFIHKRYGLCYAIPAYTAACFVGYSRLKIKEHWIQDVVGGAAIGLLYSYLFTTPYQKDKTCCFYPSMTSHHVAFHCEQSF